MKYQVAIIGGMTLLLGISQIRPLYPKDQWLHHSPMIVIIPLLFVAAGRGWISSPSMTCIVLFLSLHIVGGRYVYTAVPYDAWAESIFGSTPSEWFGATRNHYDRLVHVAFGLLAVLPVSECVERRGGQTRAWAIAIAVLAVAAIGAAYEVFEWGLTMTVAPDMADRYNGQQGDLWDSQKDMALAIAASGVSALGLCVWSRRS